MQRIDENTYIDDTLVTCAEYQLFIDEMREQGKYYQPDHWISYQFPEGQAREPILGVRHSDAVSFCNWLTSREGVDKELIFRMPIQKEADAFPIKSFERSPLGYWIDEKYEFVWVGAIPHNARGIDFDAHGIEFDTSSNNKIDLDYFLNEALDLSISLNLAIEIQDGDFGIKIHDRVPNPELALARDRTSAIDIPPLLDIILDIVSKLDIYTRYFIDIFTMRERIAGRSPAFEGIRLIKERIR